MMTISRTSHKISLFSLFLSTTLFSGPFTDLWYDGNAEISTYSISEERYGELRKGVRVMVFVTEPMRLATYIKPDEKLPENKKIRVLKLNDILRFPTGIYNYSVMTSVFSSVEKKRDIARGATMKVSFTSQEWCGTVFERAIRNDRTYDIALYSYFESEGERALSIPHHDTVETEENLWIKIRELQGPYLKRGEKKSLKLIPSAWKRRKNHKLHAIVDAILTKGKKAVHPSPSGNTAAVPFRWKYGDQNTLVWVEASYPHRILSWIKSDGSTGRLMESHREPYWRQNGNEHLYLRQKLGVTTR
ncbi:MAG: hypothetical protein GF401_18985 [Chitinivibrionales bacterium]|nr:hypothetical protein [Chitinivibrionales bacterium]